jgi:FkbM family methyltransferase
VTATESVLGRYFALRTLASMIAWFDNWGEVWRCYRQGAELPPLRFRRGFVLRHRPEDQALLQFYEVFRDKDYRRYITEPRNGAIVDIGANIGAVTLDFMTRFLEIRVHAYEPHPATFAMLRANIESNGLAPRIVTYPEAVGGRAGVIALHAGGPSMQTTGYGARAATRAREEFSVPMVALDTVIERCIADGPIALVKIDAEGAEAEILEGAHLRTLNEIPQFVIEYHDRLCPDALSRCERALAGADFRCATRQARPGQGLLYAWCKSARA